MSFLSGTIAAFTGPSATENAANTAAAAQNNATDIANQNFQKQIELNQPFYEAGKSAIPAFQSMLNGTYDMKQSPAAQWQLQQGTQALNRAMAARGLSGSGNAVNRLTELNKSVAASDWNNQYSRILDALKLGTGASSSMGSASNTNTAANQTAAQNLGQIATNEGNNQASLYAGLGGQTSNAAALGLKAYQLYNTPAYNPYNYSSAGAGGTMATDSGIGTVASEAVAL